MKKILSVVNDFRVTFNIRIVSKGDHYGLGDKLIYENDRECIEFYDSRFTNIHKLGQFIACYDIDSILEHKGKLLLYTSVSDWQVSHQNILDIQRFITRYIIMEK